MNWLKEGNLWLNPPPESNVIRFDEDEVHGLSHCMKSVDFVIEESDRLLLVEIKDPDHPKARPKDVERFIQAFRSEALDEELKYKYRDSFLYLWAAKRIAKPVHYIVVIAIERLTKAELLARTDALKRKLPVLGPRSGAWKRQIVNDCTVLNVDSWNHEFPNLTLSRLSS